MHVSLKSCIMKVSLCKGMRIQHRSIGSRDATCAYLVAIVMRPFTTGKYVYEAATAATALISHRQKCDCNQLF